MTDDTTPPTSEATESPAPAPNSFAAKLKAARETAGLSQKKTAELAGISTGTIQNWESGKTIPSPQKQESVMRRLREAQVRAKLPLESYDAQTLTETSITHPANQPGSLLPETAATPEELAHDPHEPFFKGELSPTVTAHVELDTPATLPDIPIGNVHTSQDGVVRRRLADDDEREGAEVIDGKKWFTVGFAPPHPRAKAAVRAIEPKPDLAPIPAPPQPAEAPAHTETAPEVPKPVESSPVTAVAGQRSWAWWNA